MLRIGISGIYVLYMNSNEILIKSPYLFLHLRLQLPILRLDCPQLLLQRLHTLLQLAVLGLGGLEVVCDRKLYGRNDGRYYGRKAYGRNVSALFPFRSHREL